MIKKFLLKAVVAPFTVEVMQKIGEAVGDRLGFLINPPDPEAPQPVIIVQNEPEE